MKNHYIIGIFIISSLFLSVTVMSGRSEFDPSLLHDSGNTYALLKSNENPRIDYINATDGKYEAHVRLQWNDPNRYRKYMVFRSISHWGQYEKIGTSRDTIYYDTMALQGIKYWYRIRGKEGNTYSLLSNPDSGYRRMPPPRSLNIDEVISRKRVKPVYEPEALRAEKVLRPYYKHPLKLKFIILVAKFYIKRGDLTVLGDFYRHYVNEKKGHVYLIGKNSFYTYTVLLQSKRLVRFSKKTGRKLFNRLMSNALFYCIYSGDREIKKSDGLTYMVPHYNAVGMTTEYYKNNRDWKSRTVVFDSDNPQLDAMMKRAAR